jgi:hypothetical protein
MKTSTNHNLLKKNAMSKSCISETSLAKTSKLNIKNTLKHSNKLTYTGLNVDTKHAYGEGGRRTLCILQNFAIFKYNRDAASSNT